MKRVFLRKCLASAIVAACGAVSLSGMEIAPDARKIEPLVLATGEPAVLAAQRKLMGTAARPDSSVPVFIKLAAEDADLPRKVRNLAGDATPIAPRLYAARIPRDAARYLSNWPHVSYIEAGKRARPLLDLSRKAVAADNVQAGTGLPAPFDTGITGAGSFVGIVDTGLSGAHADFRVSGPGSQSRVVHTYSSPQLAGLGLSPNAFVDEFGHGTHVSGIAAGNGFSSAGSYTGMAPGTGPAAAGILFGKTSFFTTDIADAINDFVAFTGNRPLAVNLSLGLMLGPHDGSSLFESAVNSLATGPPGSRRIIAVAAGNEFGRAEHFRQADLEPFAIVLTAVSFEEAIASVDFWADGGDRFTVTATSGSDTVTVPSGASASSPQGRIHISNPGTPSPLNGGNLISLTFLAPIGSFATIRLERTRNGGSGRLDGYIDFREGFFTSGTTNSGTLTEPANGENVIAVGSFDTKTHPAGTPSAQDISSFSSRGPTRDGRVKPDVAAPGSVIYSARSLDAPAGSYPLGLVPGNDNYAISAGTSMATPHAAGIAALLWQSNPALTGAQVRERIRRTADAPTDGSPAPNNTWGYGKINALSAVSRTVASITAPAKALPGATVALASANSSGAFDPLAIGYTLSYTWALPQQPAGSGATLASSAPAPSFTPDIPGDYTVSLTVSQSAPPGTAAGTDNAVIHVNTVPVAAIEGFAVAGSAVTFAGSATDPDVPAFGQSVTLHWVLVSRPAGSLATLSPAVGTDNAILDLDVAGTYEIGVRADDGLDNSALAVIAYPPPSGGGGGGCSIARPGATKSGAAAGTLVFLLAALAGSLAWRRRLRRRVN